MLLYYAIATLHVIVCVILVLVVLLQSGKGADLAGAFGGGATQTAFGSRGPASFLSKMTTVAAVVFMLTSIGLSMIHTKTESKSVLETTQQKEAQPAKKAPAAQPAAAVPTPEQIKRRVEELEAAKQKQQTTPAPAPLQGGQPASKPAEPKKPAQ
jgi:preprotein translocase subunit SecG